METIIIAEFHEINGKQIILSHPPDKNDYPIDLLLPRDLYGLFMMDYKGNVLITQSILLVSDDSFINYQREKYIFSVTLEVNKEQLQNNQESCFELTKKLAYLLTNLQLTKNLLYKHEQKDNHNLLKEILQNIYQDINSNNASFSNYVEQNFMYIRLQKKSKIYEHIEIGYHLVPLPLCQLNTGQLTKFNPVLEKIIPELNGIYCVGSICEKLKPLTYNQIKTTLNDLLESGLIFLVDMIHPTNWYSINDNIFQVFSKLQYKDVDHLFLDIYRQRPDYKEQGLILLQTLYCGFKRGVSLKDYLLQHQQYLIYVNILKFIRFGQINQFLQRLHEYIIIKSGDQIFDQNSIQLLSKYVDPKIRFNDIDLQEQNKQILNPYSMEYSRLLQQGKLNRIEQQIPRQQDQDKIREANQQFMQMVQHNQPFDLIGLIFNIDLKQCEDLLKAFKFMIFHSHQQGKS